ncbi:hypothetical protein M2281_000178 [Mesorhizobium soli]|uniref:hypothetical protein n=1 Tax=Pseudaminobacter soli (ex Li et al. 2025) TaxID=1295366 RepID=UPI002472F3AA|nr:hypothetical protein [Mesorhizobium soli]MDH6229606.1 hypothetical protein [Mesorhizobium soli]
MATILWPICVLPVQNPLISIASRSLTGPASVSGKSQTASSDAGLWKATFGNVVVNNRQRVICWRAIETLLEGRLNAILIPRGRDYQPRVGGSLDADLLAAVPHSDGGLFDDGRGYIGQVTNVHLAGSVAPRAVSASIIIKSGGRIEPGQDFSIGERLYRLRSVNYTSPTAAAITFRPPLREAAALGDRLEFDDPVCRMKLATDDAMDLELALRRFGNPTVNFIEDV